ncbi:MAG: hypothetical protein WCF23_21905 [Candidatus Nitrosopolaris sp.]
MESHSASLEDFKRLPSQPYAKLIKTRECSLFKRALIEVIGSREIITTNKFIVVITV